MNKNQPLVSVAIVTYNQREFLRECIDSILDQDYPNIEIVVADDCSTDGTKEMLFEYDRKHPNIFVLKLAEKNLGITKNHNAAHFSCKGKYIAWMGGDDLMLPGKISKQVAFMEANASCSVSYHNLDVFFSDTNETLFLLNNKKTAKEGGIKTAIKYGCFNGACATMVVRDKTPKEGFDERMPLASDWLYWVETLNDGGDIRYIDEVMGRYRRHSNNITSQSNYNAYIDHLNSCSILLTKYPDLQSSILYRYSENLRALRYKEKNNYLNWIKASLYVGLNIKSLISYILYFLSFKNVKK